MIINNYLLSNNFSNELFFEKLKTLRIVDVNSSKEDADAKYIRDNNTIEVYSTDKKTIVHELFHVASGEGIQFSKDN